MRSLGCILALGAFLGPAVSSGRAPHEQTQGPAVLRLEGDKIEDGRLEVRLSSTVRCTLAVEGPDTVEVEEPARLTQSKFWKLLSATKPEKVSLPGNRSRWSQQFTLE